MALSRAHTSARPSISLIIMKQSLGKTYPVLRRMIGAKPNRNTVLTSVTLEDKRNPNPTLTVSLNLTNVIRISGLQPKSNPIFLGHVPSFH